MKTVLIAALLLATPAVADQLDLTPVKAKLDVATVQIVTKDDPFGHQKKAACGSYNVYAPSGARIGLEQFVFTGGALTLQGDEHFPSAWEKNCTVW